MSKKFKVIISVLVAVLLLTASGAVAMAQDEPALVPQSESGGLLDRVAGILGIPPEKLAGAFKQARQEMSEECQATGNCGLRQQIANRFSERWTEKRQEMGKGFQGNRMESQENKRLHISEAVRGRRMIAVPKGWSGTITPQQVD